MFAIAFIPNRRMIQARDSIRASWTAAERRQRTLVANLMQEELLRRLRIRRASGRSCY
jgi:hypothetical protein